MRFFLYFTTFVVSVLVSPPNVYGQAEPERKRIGNTSVSLIEPVGIRKAPEPGNRVGFLPAFRVVEEPKSFVKIWSPRFTDKKIAKAFAKESGVKFKEILTIEVQGQIVPMAITYVKSSYQSGHVYKALFDAENSIVVIATVFDDAPITQAEILKAFQTIEINVEKPIGNFDESPFTVELTDPFEFVFSNSNSLFIKSYPQIDENYSKPTVSVGYEDLSIYDGKREIDNLQKASQYLFPVDRENFFQSDRPDYSKLRLVSQEYVELGPGKAFLIEAIYKERMALQYIWDIQGDSEFDDYLFMFAMGDKKHLDLVKNEVAKMAASLTLKEKVEPIQTRVQNEASAVPENVKPPIPRIADRPHPLSACERKGRKLSCAAMQAHSGFIFNTHLRDGGDTLQYQISAMTTSLRNEEFKTIFETQVRPHMKKAIPLAAEIIGWDMKDPATTKMIEGANAALETLVISPEELKRDPESENLMARLGMQKIEFDGGSFYGNRSAIMNHYSLYLNKPSKKKRK